MVAPARVRKCLRGYCVIPPREDRGGGVAVAGSADTGADSPSECGSGKILTEFAWLECGESRRSGALSSLGQAQLFNAVAAIRASRIASAASRWLPGSNR